MNPINTDKITAASATNISAGDPGYGNDTRMTMNRITSESVRIIQDGSSRTIIPMSLSAPKTAPGRS